MKNFTIAALATISGALFTPHALAFEDSTTANETPKKVEVSKPNIAVDKAVVAKGVIVETTRCLTNTLRRTCNGVLACFS